MLPNWQLLNIMNTQGDVILAVSIQELDSFRPKQV